MIEPSDTLELPEHPKPQILPDSTVTQRSDALLSQKDMYVMWSGRISKPPDKLNLWECYQSRPYILNNNI